MSSLKKSKLVLKSKHKKDIFLGTRTHHHCRLQRHICFVRANKIKRNNDEGFIVWRFEICAYESAQEKRASERANEQVREWLRKRGNNGIFG